MPAAAVIPAPIAYIKIVAVKTLVVGYLSGDLRSLPVERDSVFFLAFVQSRSLLLIAWRLLLNFYFEEMRVFQAGIRHEYDSME